MGGLAALFLCILTGATFAYMLYTIDKENQS